ncbi:hypothetical protein [Ilumatobacter sp.]|uniref:hypothetical protein n=1 Tax=Ilumatobacter sp. TaxID=1967498 RepID=UPI003B5174B9
MSPDGRRTPSDRVLPVRADRGSASVALVLMMTMVVAGAALIFDGAVYLAAERQASNTAEGAARAAVATGTPSEGMSEAVARRAAVDHAALLGAAAADVVVSFPSRTSVVVTVTERRPATFARFAGAESITARARGRARLEFG